MAFFLELIWRGVKRILLLLNNVDHSDVLLLIRILFRWFVCLFVRVYSNYNNMLYNNKVLLCVRFRCSDVIPSSFCMSSGLKIWRKIVKKIYDFFFWNWFLFFEIWEKTRFTLRLPSWRPLSSWGGQHRSYRLQSWTRRKRHHIPGRWICLRRS